MSRRGRKFVGSDDYFDGAPIHAAVDALCHRGEVVHYHTYGRRIGWRAAIHVDGVYAVVHANRGVKSWYEDLGEALDRERKLLLEVGYAGSRTWNTRIPHRELLGMIVGPERQDPLDCFRGADISRGVDERFRGVVVNRAKYAWNWDGTLTHPDEVAPTGPNQVTVELLIDGRGADSVAEDGPPRIYHHQGWYWVESDESEWVLLPRGFRSVEDARWYAGKVREAK